MDELGNFRRCFGDSVAYIEDDFTVRCDAEIKAACMSRACSLCATSRRPT